MSDPVSAAIITAEVVNVVASAAISVGASLLEATLTPPDGPNAPSYPATNITRGGYLPSVMGRRVIGYHMGWVGDRHFHAAPHSGGSEITPKPSSGQVYYEGGWHQLCMGPVRRLYRIWMGAKVIWNQTLDSQTTPNGSLFQLPVLNNARDADYFRIYFGLDPQPVDQYLLKNTNCISMWPGLCYIMWQRKNLGSSPTWPQMKYEIETVPEDIFGVLG